MLHTSFVQLRSGLLTHSSHEGIHEASKNHQGVMAMCSYRICPLLGVRDDILYAAPEVPRVDDPISRPFLVSRTPWRSSPKSYRNG